MCVCLCVFLIKANTDDGLKKEWTAVKERLAETSKHCSDSVCGKHQGRVCRIRGRSVSAVSDSKDRGATYLDLVLVLDLDLDLDQLEVPPGEPSTLRKRIALV